MGNKVQKYLAKNNKHKEVIITPELVRNIRLKRKESESIVRREKIYKIISEPLTKEETDFINLLIV